MPMNEVMTLSLDSIESFRQWLSDHGRSEHTIKSYSSDLQQLLLSTGEGSIPFSDLETLGMRWLTAHRRTLSPKTTGRRLTSLRTFAKWAGRPELFIDYTAPTPLKHIPDPLPDGMPGVFRMIERAENSNLKVMTALCGLAGLRISEAIALSASCINWSEGLLIVRGKGDKTRMVPMGAQLRDILLEPALRQLNRPTVIEVNGAPINDRLARRSITRLGKRARVPGQVHSHQLRATYATHLHDIGVPIRIIQELLGHADVKTTEGYTAVVLEGMRNAVKGL